MEFLLSKEITYADGLSRLIPKNTEPREETIIASLTSEMDIKYVLFNTVKELPVTLEEIKFKTKFDKFINQTKKELVERFVYVFKRAIKKANGIEAENEELQEFLSICRITPNSNTNANKSPVELMFALKIQSVFD